MFLGLGRDFWQPFEDYARAEQGRSSTFFLIPFKGQAGVGPDGSTRALRAAPYNIREIRTDIEASSGPRTEFAVHGIDAWRDADAGRAELKELAAVTGQQKPGIRMHWLYFSDHSPRQLEDAGFAYDSTWGYNDAVGYRAGTSQVFRLPGTQSFLELPLTIMDSALFYTDRMGLDRQEAMERCRGIVQHARRFGGALVIDWHGLGSSGAGQAAISGYKALADQEGFIIAWPDGIDQAWNVGPCCTTSRSRETGLS